MKSIFALITLLCPSLALAGDLDVFLASCVTAETRYQQQCDGVTCRLVPVTTYRVVRSVEAVPVVRVSAPVAASTCNCSETGVCTCDPATCRCAACATGQRAMATAANAAVYSAPAATANVYSSPRGPVTLTKDGNGNAIITHQGGPYGRRLARHLARGVRLGVQ